MTHTSIGFGLEQFPYSGIALRDEIETLGFRWTELPLHAEAERHGEAFTYNPSRMDFSFRRSSEQVAFTSESLPEISSLVCLYTRRGIPPGYQSLHNLQCLVHQSDFAPGFSPMPGPIHSYGSNEPSCSLPFERMLSLRLLSLTGPYETALPASLGCLRSLRHLLLCNVWDLPESIGDLESLKTMQIVQPSSRYILGRDKSSRLRLPESFGNLKSLELLHLCERDPRRVMGRGIELLELPGSFGNLTSLVDLDLQQSPLQHLPESFGNLKSLQRLNLAETALKELPESFGNLTSLRSLDARAGLGPKGKSLVKLPESFGGLKSLEEVDIGGQPIMKLPESFGDLTSLRSLDLRCTRLRQLPKSFGNLTSLRSLDLNGTPIASLPQTFGNLKSLQLLDLGSTSLDSLPEEIGGLASLRDLRLSSTSIHELPKSFANLKSLERLELRDTRLAQLPECEHLPGLKHIDLEGSAIVVWPPVSSRFLRLDKSLIRDVPKIVGDHLWFPHKVGRMDADSLCMRLYLKGTFSKADEATVSHSLVDTADDLARLSPIFRKVELVDLRNSSLEALFQEAAAAPIETATAVTGAALATLYTIVKLWFRYREIKQKDRELALRSQEHVLKESELTLHKKKYDAEWAARICSTIARDRIATHGAPIPEIGELEDFGKLCAERLDQLCEELDGMLSAEADLLVVEETSPSDDTEQPARDEGR